MPNTDAQPLALHQSVVRPEWIDYNGHMNVAYYVLAFDHAMDAFLDYVGLGVDYVKRDKGSIFVAESHICYLNEVVEGDRLYFTTQIIGAAAKKLHLFYTMYKGDDATGELVATIEVMAIHVDLQTRRAASIPAAQAVTLQALAENHGKLEMPSGVGRVIGGSRANG